MSHTRLSAIGLGVLAVCRAAVAQSAPPPSGSRGVMPPQPPPAATSTQPPAATPTGPQPASPPPPTATSTQPQPASPPAPTATSTQPPPSPPTQAGPARYPYPATPPSASHEAAAASSAPGATSLPGSAAEPPVEPESEPYGWNLGAGISARTTEGGLSGTSGPAYVASIERRLVGQTWLFFGATASYTSDDVAPFGGNDTAPDTVRITETSYALLLGVRPVVVSGLVDVSLWVAGRAGRQVFGGDEIDPTVQIPIRPGTRSTTLGGLFGMAVERELVDALALRISAQIGSVSYSSLDEVRVRDDEKRTTEQSLWSARLSLSPGFDLRLYF